MTDHSPTGPRAEPADSVDPAAAELADAMGSIRSTGEDWRSSERAIESDETHDEKEHDNG